MLATYRFVIIVPDLFLQLLYSHSYSRGTSNFERFHLGLAESLCGPCVVRAHARASAAFVRASGYAARRDAYSSAPERFGSAVLSLPWTSAAACLALCALGEHCRHCVVLVVLLPRVRDDVLPVRPDARV